MFFDRSEAPPLESGLVALWTSGSFLNADTVSSIGCLYSDAVIFLPDGAVSTTGFVPLAWEGKRAWSWSVARWLSVPGSVRLSLRFGPAVRARIASATNTTSQTPTTIQCRRAQKPPRR